VSNEPTEQSFLKDVSKHEMTIIRVDGVNRHVRFKEPGTSNMYFDLITWPGYLCYCGDMGTFVFQRLEDMFQFFRTDRKHLRDGRTLAVNHSYWAEKVEATDKCDGVEEFDEEKFKRVILEYLVEWIRNHRTETTKEQRRELWDDVISGVINADGDSGGYRKQIAAHEFSHRINAETEFYFQDFWERSLTRYTYRFIWCCYALAWGIQKYDERVEAA